MVTKKTLQLFNEVYDTVPAYRDFLKSHKFNPKSVLSAEDFKNVPLTSKQNYLKQYPFTELYTGGHLYNQLVFCSTSGSTGEPFYFGRTDNLSTQYSELIESYLRVRNGTERRPTLVIITLGMGVWIGGVITLQAFEKAAKRSGDSVSILPVGYNKTEVIKALKQLAPQFKEVILVGYPPFIKEIVDECMHESIDLKKLNARMLFAAESFTESFRDYLCKRTGADPVLDTLNIYGTADIGAMAFETPLSIFIRRESSKNKQLFKALFGQIQKTPTLAQYDPDYMTFEEVDGEIVISGNSAVPLIRYAVGDHGGVLSHERVLEICQQFNIDLDSLPPEVRESYGKKLPFVFVYERVNFSVSLHGIIIYPEFIKEALLQPDLAPYFTEKFTMITKTDEDLNQYLEINLELQRGVASSAKLRSLAKKIITSSLVERSSEFSEVSKEKGSAKLIKCVLWETEHPLFFAPGVKQKWVIK